jgi:hypothetical protein
MITSYIGGRKKAGERANHCLFSSPFSLARGVQRSSSDFTFEQTRLAAQEKERIRIMKMLHDEVSSPMLAVIFAIAAQDDLEARAVPQPGSLKKASELLTDALEKMAEALELKSADGEPRPTAR